MKVIGTKIINDIEVPIVLECISMEVGGNGSDFDEKLKPENCRIRMRSTHPTVSFFIIRTDKQKHPAKGTSIRPYKWLTKSEAEAIMKRAAESDVIDLKTLGNYQIIAECQIQSMYIMNNIDDYTGAELPLLVKVVDED